jgi:hypothetical protein
VVNRSLSVATIVDGMIQNMHVQYRCDEVGAHESQVASTCGQQDLFLLLLFEQGDRSLTIHRYGSKPSVHLSHLPCPHPNPSLLQNLESILNLIPPSPILIAPIRMHTTRIMKSPYRPPHIVSQPPPPPLHLFPSHPSLSLSHPSLSLSLPLPLPLPHTQNP